MTRPQPAELVNARAAGRYLSRIHSAFSPTDCLGLGCSFTIQEFVIPTKHCSSRWQVKQQVERGRLVLQCRNSLQHRLVTQDVLVYPEVFHGSNVKHDVFDAVKPRPN